jgi:cell division protein ZapA (FtsZ GTPase activity inhibitor)
MSKLSLKVVVAGRTYPLTLNEGEQEKVLQAAEDINKAIKLLQDNYAVKDMQDLLAMTALQLATKPKGQGNSVPQEADFSAIENALQGLSNELEGLE